LVQMVESTLSGMGYDLVDYERSQHGRNIRIFIDKPDGINVDDCAAVSTHLSRLFAVEGVDYANLEVSSPGLDRLLKKDRDFVRFAGETIRIKLKVPMNGQRKFIGTIVGVFDGNLKLDTGAEVLSLELVNLDRARLVPKI
jgi:ribosome maturation factor RimP